MKEKNQTFHMIRKLHIIPAILSGIVLFIADDFIIDFLYVAAMGNIYDAMSYKIARLLDLAILWTAWGIFCYLFIISSFYRLKTGRSYIDDRHHYKRSLGDLLDFFEDAEPHKLDTSIYPETIWTECSGIVFGKSDGHLIHLPTEAEGNIAVFGPPGTGKTSGIAIPSAMQFGGSVLAVDIKGDIYNFVHAHSNRKILRFAPDAENALDISCSFDPLLGVEEMDETDLKNHIANMANCLIPDDGSEGNYFPSRARKLFRGITHAMLHDNIYTSFPDIVRAVLHGNVFQWVNQIIEGDCEIAKELVASLKGNSEKNVSGAYDSMTSSLEAFSGSLLQKLLGKSNGSVSVKQLDEGYDIYLQVSQTNLKVYAPLFTMVIQTLSEQLSARPDLSTGIYNKPVLILLDELPQLTFNYELLDHNMATLRSKNVKSMLLQQNYSQLEYRFKESASRSLIGNCSYQVILGSNDVKSSKMFSDLFGTKKCLKVTTSSGKHSVQDDREPVYPQEYFGDLSREKKLVLYNNGKYAELMKINCYTDL